jgi:hypothetical protein
MLKSQRQHQKSRPIYPKREGLTAEPSHTTSATPRRSNAQPQDRLLRVTAKKTSSKIKSDGNVGTFIKKKDSRPS